MDEVYSGKKTELASDVAAKHDVEIIAVEKYLEHKETPPSETYYKLVRDGTQYLIYTYIVDDWQDKEADRRDDMPKKFTREQALAVWGEFKKHIGKGAEIGRGCVFWEATLRRDGTVNPHPSEDWSAAVRSTYIG